MSINPYQQQQGNLYKYDNPHESPWNELEDCDISQNTLYSHHTDVVKDYIILPTYSR